MALLSEYHKLPKGSENAQNTSVLKGLTNQNCAFEREMSQIGRGSLNFKLAIREMNYR